MENDCRGVALLRLKTALRNRMAINKITDNFMIFFAIISCGIGMRRSSATPLQSPSLLISILNRQFSIINYRLDRPNGGGVKQNNIFFI